MVKKYVCRAKSYSWAHGVGVEIEIKCETVCVGLARLLCASDHAHFKVISKLPETEMICSALDCFVNSKSTTTIEITLKWQNAIKKLGNNYVSPIYGNLDACF